MNSETENYQLDIKLDSKGDIDVDYYLRKADELRAEYLSELYVSSKQRIKSGLIEFYEKFICLKCQPSH